MITVRDATAADIRAYYGQALPHTVQALMLVKGEQLVGIIGVATITGRRILFSESTPDLGDDIRSFAVRRAIFRVARLAMAAKLPVFSQKEADSDVLTRLGFEHVSGDIYQWPGSPLPLPTSLPPPPP